MWQAEADTELTLSASPTTAVGQKALALAKRRYSTVTYEARIFAVRSLEDPPMQGTAAEFEKREGARLEKGHSSREIIVLNLANLPQNDRSSLIS